MKRTLGGLCALLLWSGSPAAAQESDAFVLPRGEARLRVEGVFTSFDSRFAADSTVGLAAGLGAPLTAAAFPPLQPSATELASFLAGTQSAPGATPLPPLDPLVTFGTPDVAVSANTRTMPIRLEVGVMPRLEVGVMLPLVQSEVLVQRFLLPGATFGVNTDTAANVQRLRRIDARWAALGRARFLPSDSSALGRELQARVVALGGDSLSLPNTPLSAAQLNALVAAAYGVGPVESRVSDLSPGDLEVGARFRLLSSFGAAPVPADSTGVHYRAAVSAALRLPTGTATDSVFLVSAAPAVGLAGARVGFDGDLFYGPRVWASVSARFAVLQETDVLRRVAPPGAPLSSAEPARSVRWTPGSELELRVVPRYRLTPEISVGGQYALVRSGASTFAGAAELDVEAQTAHLLGATARYTTLPAVAAGRGSLPVEVAFGFATTLAASGPAPDASFVTIQATLYRRIWGR